MKFEDLANELLLDLFELFDLINLFRAFSGLNIRFNQLLFTHCGKYRLDLRCISKNDFESTCQYYLPLIIDRIISLAISDDDETPHVPDLFLSYGFTLDQFKNLRILSLYSISSIDILNKITFQCHHLQHLTHLYLVKCYSHCEEKDIRLLMNNIWSISNLTHCYLHCFHPDSHNFIMSTSISQSIKCVIIKSIKLDLNDLSNLSQYTPHLRQLSITVNCPLDITQLENLTLSITSLNLIYYGSIDTMKYLLENIKNLSYLTLETWNIYLNGYEWEEILVNIILQIKRFRLKMNFDFKHIVNQEEEVETLLTSFSTQFWIEIQQQYFRCQWTSSAVRSDAIIYSLPYTFGNSSYGDSTCSKSTCPNEIDFWSYDCVEVVEYFNNRPNLVNNSVGFHAQFRKVNYLNITFLFNKDILSVYPSLNYLTTLHITVNRLFDYSQLQILLDRAPHLYSLKLCKVSDIQLTLSYIRNLSIHRLELIEKDASNGYFNDIECTALINSSIGFQCEVLLIHITNRTIILNLFNQLPNLRMLIINCEDDKWKPSQDSDELIQYVHDYLPSTCLINRDTEHPYYIQIWIDCKSRRD